MCLVDRDGRIQKLYRKHFLFSVDEQWATEGSGFDICDVEGLRFGLGICMDINPKRV